MTAAIGAVAARDSIELWGGIECTVNRIGDRYFSQLDRSGHSGRPDDLERAASLGISAIRYPVLWERTAPNGMATANWTWPDERLGRLRALALTPIVGLLHHGSGPVDTSLVDPEFPAKLAEYASAVAARYPWVEYYTPVNEPLTTARFSGLYGFWYPHGGDERTFKDALIVQCRGIVTAMNAIRAIRPDAKLVHTEDLGKTYSTQALAYQARFNNELRWLSWDLLCGRVDKHHFLWGWLTRDCGAEEPELAWFQENACPPDLMGVNHYVTSERFLDERLDRYPPEYHGSNRRDRYADIEAARCLATPTGGLEPLLLEVWNRFKLPLAVTEAHIDSTRDDHVRWLSEVWNAAGLARAAGADVRAVTVWALFGSYDWNCLLTDCRGYYEPGAFDVRGRTPRPTAVAVWMRGIKGSKEADHPVLSAPGWWRRPGRFLCPPVRLPSGATDRPPAGNNTAQILITGATGTLGAAFARICEARGLAFRLLNRRDLDITDTEQIERALEHLQPWAVINTAGYVRVDDAESDLERCFRENTTGPAALAAVCARHRVSLVTFSSDLVFDGMHNEPYLENHPVAPLCVYGESKARAETLVLERHSSALVIRTSAFFGPWDEHNFITVALRTLREKRRFVAASDLTVSPTYVPDLVNATLDLLIDGENGLWHLSNSGGITWADLARRAAETAGVDLTRLVFCDSARLGFVARRPRYSVLGSSRSSIMPPLEHALARYVAALRPAAAATTIS